MDNNKILLLKELIEKHQIERLHARKLDCQCNIDNAKVSIKEKKKYTYMDIGNSGRYMIDNATGEIFGIKAYGVIHRGHFYGNLETIYQYFWGDYRAFKK